ncbi:kunitz-type protease inhibitor 1 isoform X2 [Nothoprocta perdicaria]|uniref:kunitz-type protease inhibitor 1 isoform X2 n=1 Tax=Nothoprocta perdicaria TaxID=30464 RepID=UPI000E1BE990|nr:kunitz-type protease inhibitor 1 isoform X2 [Nothoprocta perdicaria]
MVRGRRALPAVLWAALVLLAAPRWAQGQEEKPFGEACLDHFTTGMPDFVLDTDASVQNGATFLSSPQVHRGRDCVRACCKDPMCNLALVEQHPGAGEDHIQGCFLLNCLYRKTFVCRFARKMGFLNYVKRNVYDAYLSMQERGFGDDHPPIARTGMNMKVQPGEVVLLRGTESTDDHGIVSYEWKQIHGDPSVEMKILEEDQVEVSNLQMGIYVFQLTVTDTAQQQDFANFTILVLNSEQTEEHCLTPKKVGRCRGSFPRWFYNPSLQQCEPFIFGGCKPNKNNYLREEECKLACKNVKGSVGGRQQPDAREFNRLQKINITNEKGHCVDLPDTGLCTESIPRWYYNPFTEKCDRFTYGGCDGNQNNFGEEEECMKSCTGITKADVIGRRWESFEHQTASLSAFEVVIAVLLAICIMVVLVIIGYFFLKKRKNSRRRQPATATNSTLSTSEDTTHLFYNGATKPV